MKTPTRILVGGPEVTSAFVLMGLALARRAMMQGVGCATDGCYSGILRCVAGDGSPVAEKGTKMSRMRADRAKIEAAMARALVRLPNPHHNRAHSTQRPFTGHCMTVILVRVTDALFADCCAAIGDRRRHHRHPQNPRGRPGPDRQHPNPSRRHRRAGDGSALPQCQGRALDLRHRRARRADQICRQQDLDLPHAGTPIAAAATVARCEVDGEDIQKWLVRNGWALSFMRFSHDYEADEKAAHEAKAGMWQGAFIAPWDWRVRNKKTVILGAAKPPEKAAASCWPRPRARCRPRPTATSRATSTVPATASIITRPAAGTRRSR